MQKYEISKIGRVGENASFFGDTRDSFIGYSETGPVENERFVLFTKSKIDVVINTSPVMKIEKDKFYTLYSVYSIKILSDD